MKEVYGYVRVSGKSQLEGDGFPRQKESILAFCASQGWLCKRIFEERAVPGKTEMEDRVAFMEMLSLCGDQLPTTIVVERADRVARDLIVGELLYRECATAGVQIYTADSGQELVMAEDTDPTRKLIRQLLGAVAEWNKDEIVKKMRVARERIRARGERCEGAKPYEILNPAESALVLAWIVAARQRGNSFHAITKQLNLGTEYRPPNGGKWQSSTVHKLYTRHMKQLTERND